MACSPYVENVPRHRHWPGLSSATRRACYHSFGRCKGSLMTIAKLYYYQLLAQPNSRNHVGPVSSGLAIAGCIFQYTPDSDLRPGLTTSLQFMPTGADHARRSHRSTSNSRKHYRCPTSPPSSRSTPSPRPASSLLKNTALARYPPSSSSATAASPRRSRVATRRP